MSVQAITWAYAQPDLSSAEKFVLVTLSNRADEDWSCYPSIQLIATDTSLSEKTVRRALDDLENRSLIHRKRQRNPDGSLGRYRYFLKPPVTMTTGEKGEQSLGVVTMTTGRKPSKKQHAVTVTGRDNSQQDQHAVTMTSGVTPVVPSGHHVQNPSGHHDRSTKPNKHINRQKEDSSEKLRSSDLSNAFIEIWQLWPGPGRERSKSKKLCLEALTRACGDRQPALMVEAVRNYVRKQKPADQKFTPALDRWLKDGKFEHFAPSSNVHALPQRDGVDWPAILANWFDTGDWPRGVGDPPSLPGYRGPLDAAEALIPRFTPGHPTATAMRRIIDQRRRA